MCCVCRREKEREREKKESRQKDRSRAGVGKGRATWKWKVWLDSPQLLRAGVEPDIHNRTARTYGCVQKLMSEGNPSKGLETDAKRKRSEQRKSAFVSKTKKRGMVELTHGAHGEALIPAASRLREPSSD